MEAKPVILSGIGWDLIGPSQDLQKNPHTKPVLCVDGRIWHPWEVITNCSGRPNANNKLAAQFPGFKIYHNHRFVLEFQARTKLEPDCCTDD